jgi:hypothetical protein
MARTMTTQVGLDMSTSSPSGRADPHIGELLRARAWEVILALAAALIGYVVPYYLMPPLSIPAGLQGDTLALAQLLADQALWAHKVLAGLTAAIAGISVYLVTLWVRGVTVEQNLRGLSVSISAIDERTTKTATSVSTLVSGQLASSALSTLGEYFQCKRPIDLYEQWARDIASNGHLVVFDMTDVFSTDQEIISSLSRSEGPLISTVISGDDAFEEKDFPEFEAYVDAQLKKAKEGLSVHRFYFLRSFDSILATKNKLTEHLKRLRSRVLKSQCQGTFHVYVVNSEKLKLDGGFDLVAFGNRCISEGRIARRSSQLIGADYYQPAKAPPDQQKRLGDLRDWIAGFANGHPPNHVQRWEET